MATTRVIRAFAPASLSCFFKPYRHKNPRWAGSYGVGFTVDKGVVVVVKKSQKTEIFFNKKLIQLPTALDVIKKLTKEQIHVEISSPLPLGCGFGLSGASALATAYAVNKLLHLKKKKKELAIIAHTAEVENKTGLGNIVNQYFGGFFLKRKPSSYFLVERIPIIDKHIYYKVFSKFSTKSALSNISTQRKLEQAGSAALHKVKPLLRRNKKITVPVLISIGKQYVLAAGILKHKKTKITIENIEKGGGAASMLVFGNVVYSNRFFRGAKKLKISRKKASLI